jgi:hypothetical protein
VCFVRKIIGVSYLIFLFRSLAGDFFPSVFDCPHETDRIGNLGDGGKWLCGLSRIEDKPDCVVYTVGASASYPRGKKTHSTIHTGFSHETSFEREILERTTGCRIWAYDDQVNHFDVQSSQRHRTHFDHYLLSDVDAHGSKDNPKRYTLDALMRINSTSNLVFQAHSLPVIDNTFPLSLKLHSDHTFIDVIKVDLEGGEFSTLSSFLHKYVAADEPVPFGQLLLEIHLWNKKFSEVLAFWELLETAGLRPFRSEARCFCMILESLD